jgi:hypothetical protein
VPLPLGHGQAATRRLTPRERRLVSGVLGAVVVLVVIVAVALATGARTPAHGCIHVTIPGPVGAEQIDGCGAQARATCRAAARAGAFTAPSAAAIERACRRAGLAAG